MIKKYRKKPVVVEAIEVKKDNYPEIVKFVGKELEFMCSPSDLCALKHVVIPTLEGKMTAMVGDFIIKGINGEFYPCKPDIFKKTYEEVDRKGIESE